MPELVGDIKKIDQDKIKKDREILLKYLSEVEAAAGAKKKPAEKKALDSLVRKQSDDIRSESVPDVAPPVEAKIDFVRDFKTSESKLKPITEIIHAAIAKSQPEQKIEEPKKIHLDSTVKTPRKEVKIEKKLPKSVITGEKKHLFSFLSSKKIKDKPAKISERSFFSVTDLKKAGQTALRLLGRILFKFFSIFTVIIIIYFVFSLSLYTFAFDNFASRFITKVFPVPAFITQYGPVNYYEYLDEKNIAIKEQKDDDKSLAETLASVSAREKIIKRQILVDLAKSYGISEFNFNSQDGEKNLKNKISGLILADPAFNFDNLRKLKSIKGALLGGADFMLVANSFGLEAKIEYLTFDAIRDKFGTNALDISSEAIKTAVASEGYYVYKLFEYQNGTSGINYIFVPATTLEFIESIKFKSANLIILAN